MLLLLGQLGCDGGSLDSDGGEGGDEPAALGGDGVPAGLDCDDDCDGSVDGGLGVRPCSWGRSFEAWAVAGGESRAFALRGKPRPTGGKGGLSRPGCALTASQHLYA